MKKFITCFITLVLLLSQLTSFAYPVSTTASSDSTVAHSTSLDNPYQKIHVYTGQDATRDYSTIQNESQLAEAIQSLKTYSTHATPLKAGGSDIRITVEFESHFDETDEFISFRQNMREAKSFSEIREIRKTFNSFSKKYHSAILKANLPLLDSIDYDLITEIGYSPFTILETSQEAIEPSSLRSLATNTSIMSISLEPNYDLSAIEAEIEEQVLISVDNNTTINATIDEEIDLLLWDEMLQLIGADSVVDFGLYQGEGIHIGVLETGICDITNANLVGKNITTYPSTGKTTHATAVVSTILRIAPQANIISARSSIYPTLEIFIENNCDIVNMSHHLSVESEYLPTCDGIYDYQIYTHSITFVGSSGNKETSDITSSPKKAYNAITVGGVQKTNSGTIVYNPNACYTPFSSGGNVKPNISAMSYFYIPNTTYASIPANSTSFTSPQVTACVALLMEAYMIYDEIYLFPEDIMALIMASAEKTNDYQGYSVGYNSFDERIGAGVINLNNALSADTVLDNFTVSSADQGEIVYSQTVLLSAGKTIQVALSMLVPTEMEGTDAAYPIDFTDFNIYLVPQLSEDAVASSTLSDASNHELFRYYVSTTQRYRIIVRANESQLSSSPSSWLSIAYSIK